MNIFPRIKDTHAEMSALRRALHQNAQTKYEEVYASDLVARKLKDWGIPFERGIAVTGIVATIKGRSTDSGRSIGLRADMDALKIQEQSGVPHACTNGAMHACGHDGHTAGLLAAAKHLQETRNFNGTVQLIFQPAEEGGCGADLMIKEGLFEKFPVDYIFGVHNWPWGAVGTAGTCVGPLLASVDEFKITLTGKGGHAAMPQSVVDPIVIASTLVSTLQSIVARNVNPLDSAVVSVTNFNSGTGAFNIIPNTAVLEGTVRTFNNETRNMIQTRMNDLVTQIASAHGAHAELTYLHLNDPTINTADGVEMAGRALIDTLGAGNVDTKFAPTMGGEDFGSYLRLKPGAFVFLGQSEPNKMDSPHNHGVHSPFYDFNDEVLPIAASFFTRLVEQYMPLG